MGLLKGACCGCTSKLRDFDVTRKWFTSSSIFMRFPFNQDKAVREGNRQARGAAQKASNQPNEVHVGRRRPGGMLWNFVQVSRGCWIWVLVLFAPTLEIRLCHCCCSVIRRFRPFACVFLVRDSDWALLYLQIIWVSLTPSSGHSWYSTVTITLLLSWFVISFVSLTANSRNQNTQT